MPAKRVEEKRAVVTAHIHTAFLSLAMHIIRDVHENGPSVENLGRYYAMSAMREALAPAINGGLTRLRFEAIERVRLGEFAQVMLTGKPPRPGEERDEDEGGEEA